jgi:predicted transcriptional regulator
MAEKKETNSLNLELLLTRLVDALGLANEKLDSLIALNGEILKMHKRSQHKSGYETSPRIEPNLDPDVVSLLSLPASLRKTIMVLYKLDKATAEGISKETKRLRAVESAAANQLSRMGYLKKKREGRNVYFYIDSSIGLEK